MSAKTASGKLESELKQETVNAQDLRKMLAEERNVMSTMDMEHQQMLVELEQRHQEKVLIAFTHIPRDIHIYKMLSSIYINILYIFLFVQVLYLLNQLQSKPISEESDETKQQDQELLQRLKVQVCPHKLV